MIPKLKQFKDFENLATEVKARTPYKYLSMSQLLQVVERLSQEKASLYSKVFFNYLININTKFFIV